MSTSFSVWPHLKADLDLYLYSAYYTGTTVLLGAFLAGVTLPFLSTSSANSPTFLETYQLYVEPLQNYILVPFFFGSIGFSIPFLQLWTGRIVWKGIVYSILMTLGKILVGACVIANDLIVSPKRSAEHEEQETNFGKERNRIFPLSNTRAERSRQITTSSTSSSTLPIASDIANTSSHRGTFISETLPAAAFLGLALVARGEIGVSFFFLSFSLSATAQSNYSRTDLGITSSLQFERFKFRHPFFGTFDGTLLSIDLGSSYLYDCWTGWVRSIGQESMG